MTDGGRPRILLVDDDMNVLEALQRQLRRGFEVMVANGAKEALKLVVSQGPFAVIVSDLRMPGMDGISLLYLVRKAAPDTVRVLLTGHADLDAAVAAVNEGNIFRFLVKPCPPGKLLRALEASVEQHRILTASH